MGKLRILLVLGVLCCGCGRVVPVDGPVSVVPAPVSVTPAEGVFRLSASTRVVVRSADERMSFVTDALDDVLRPIFGRGLTVCPAAPAQDGAVNFIGTDSIPSDGYSLTIAPDRIEVLSGGPEGAFYAVQTLRQLLPAAAFGAGRVKAVELPAVVVEDRPGMGYRGMMLDVARHFFTVEEVKRVLDLLALHKMNVFHWHLTDDQGWRFEVKSLPELAVKGSVRPCTVVGKNIGVGNAAGAIYDDTPETGYYTQEEMKEIVRYAEERFITIVPEIDLPGHMIAALSVYPELGCTGGPYNVWCRWGIAQDVLCAGNPKTLDFLHKVMDEVCEVFPGKLIHIGGDESPRNRWKACPKCQKKMKELGLKNEAELQTYINKDMEAYLAAKGREIIGWDETLEGGLSEKASVMSWRGYKGGIEAARQHHHVVMSPTNHCYIDYYQLKNHDAQPLAIGGYLPVSTVYSMEPVPAELTEEEGKFIVGAQCNLWTEYVVSPDHAMYMLLPRLAAMCEVQWMQPQAKNYEEFSKKRLPAMQSIYRKLGYKYCSTIE